MIGIGVGPGFAQRRRAWTPRKLGASWVFDPAQLTLSGSNITAAASAGGSAVVLTAASGAEPVVATDGAFAGKTVIRTSNTATKLFSATGGVTGNAPWHVVAILEYMAPAGGPALLANFVTFGAPAASGCVGLGATNAARSCISNGSGTFNYGALDTGPHILDAKYDGTTMTVRIDDVLQISLAKTWAVPDVSFGLMNWYVGAYSTLDVRISSQAIACGKTFAQAEINAFLRYELTRLAGVTGRGRVVAMFGDSTTEGTAIGAEPLQIGLRLAHVAPNVVFPANHGVSGEKASQIATRLDAYTGAATHVTIWCGRNLPASVSPSADAATTYAGITQMVAHAHTIGAKAVVGTLNQWGLSPAASYTDTYRLALNVLIAANAAGADAIADVDAAIGPYNAVNFCADTIHENIAAERAYVAPCLYAALLTT